MQNSAKHHGNFVAYYRDAAFRVVDQQLSIDDQKDAVRTYLNGGTWQIVGEFTENETNRQSRRTALQEALDLCRIQSATLIVANIDRLYRNSYFLSLVAESKVPFLCVDNPDINQLNIGLLLSLATAEFAKISVRQKSVLASLKASGRKLGSPDLSYAQQRAGEVVSISADRFADRVLPIIDDLRAKGYLSYREIAVALNEMNVPTARGGEWFASTVRNAEMRRKNETSTG